MSRHSVSSFFINVIIDVSTKGYTNNVKNKVNNSDKLMLYCIMLLFILCLYIIFIFKFTCLQSYIFYHLNPI